MAAHILPFIKAVAPYIAQVATIALPAFTAKTDEETKAGTVVAQQIAELQKAVTQNAQSVHILAEKLQQTIEGLEITAENARAQAETYKTALFFSIGFSVISLGLSIYLLFQS